MGRFNYRKLAFDTYDQFCALCGFGVHDVLEVCHIDGNRNNNRVGNLVILCANCHKRFDINLVSERTIREMRDRPRLVNWKKRMKDAGLKAKNTRKRHAAARRRAARKAVETRMKKRKSRQ